MGMRVMQTPLGMTLLGIGVILGFLLLRVAGKIVLMSCWA
jgi:hypothetical protein